MTTNDQIIQLLASGYTVKEIAADLKMKFVTVKKRIVTMKKKNDCKTVTHLVVKWLELSPPQTA
jgi:DNA-binding NarL/FixJ family response regulator